MVETSMGNSPLKSPDHVLFASTNNRNFRLVYRSDDWQFVKLFYRMKDIQKCSEEIKIKMKVKNEDNTAVASENGKSNCHSVRNVRNFISAIWPLSPLGNNNSLIKFCQTIAIIQHWDSVPDMCLCFLGSLVRFIARLIFW